MKFKKGDKVRVKNRHTNGIIDCYLGQGFCFDKFWGVWIHRKRYTCVESNLRKIK